MNDEQIILKRIVDNAISAFNGNEMYLLENDLSERCICSRFALYLQNEILDSITYKDYIVDVEYNRGANGHDYKPKRLANSDKPITVDLVVHKRGYSEQVRQHGARQVVGYRNLICIEMKKPKNAIRNRNAIIADKDRLKKLTRNSEGFGYSIGFMIFVKENGLLIDESIYDTYN